MKKLNQKGFTHHLVMFAVLALVLGAMGFAGYRVYQNRNIDAKAAGYQSIPLSGGASVNLCSVITPRSERFYIKNPTSTPLQVKYLHATTGGWNTVNIKARSSSKTYPAAAPSTIGIYVMNAAGKYYGKSWNINTALYSGRNTAKTC